MPQRLVPSRLGLLLGVVALLVGVGAVRPADHLLGATSHRHDAVAVAAAHPVLHPTTGATERGAGGSGWRGDGALPAAATVTTSAATTTPPLLRDAPVGPRSRDRSPPLPA